MHLHRSKSTAVIVLAIILLCAANTGTFAQSRNYYQLKVYHFTSAAQETQLDEYFQHALVPALHRRGIPSVGIFKPVMQQDSDKRVFVFIPFGSMDQFSSLEQSLLKDSKYLVDGKAYIDAEFNSPPYTRIESIVLQAFPGMPQPAIPALTAPRNQRVYELRSYESATEKLNVNKVKMFNEGNEIEIFSRLGFNAVFYSEVISGGHMPNLMYMTAFNSKEDRDAHWAAFNNDPHWKELFAMTEYKNNVSHIDITFLHPTDYSDF